MGSRCCYLAFACLTVACGGGVRAGHDRASGGAGGVSEGGASDGGALQHRSGSAGAASQGGGTGSGGTSVDPNGGLVGGFSSVEPAPGCEDDDGLSPPEEGVFRLDPCNPDTDGDGCIDGAEVRLGGCEDPRNAIIVHQCDGAEPGASMTFVAPDTDGGVWPSLTLEE